MQGREIETREQIYVYMFKYKKRTKRNVRYEVRKNVKQRFRVVSKFLGKIKARKIKKTVETTNEKR